MPGSLGRPLPAFTLAVALVSSLATGAQASPTREAAALAGAGSLVAVALSDDDRYVAVAESSGSGLAVWDTASFSSGPSLATVCTPATDVAFAKADGGDARFYVSCSGGAVHYVTVDGSTTPPTLTVSSAISLAGSTTEVLALVWAPGDDVVHALTFESNVQTLHRVSLEDDSVAVVLATPLLAGEPVSMAIGASGTPVLVPRSDGYLGWFSRSGTTYSTVHGALLVQFGGKLGAVAVEESLGLALVADDEASTLWSLPLTGTAVPLAFGDDLDGIGAIAFVAEADGPRAYVGTDEGLVVVLDDLGEALRSIALSEGSAEDFAPASTDQGTVYVAGSDGLLHILTDRPFLSGVSVDKPTVGGSESFTLSFTSDQDGDYDVRVGGGMDPDSGSSLATGQVEAGVGEDLVLDSDTLPVEGDNRLFVFVTSDSGLGLDSVSVVLDRPPPVVDDPEVASGDSRLVLSWTSGSDGDLSHFLVYLSEQPFESLDATLPSLSVTSPGGTSSYPLSVTAGEPLSGQSVSMNGLTNGQPYYAAVQAVDEAGQHSPLSAVVSGTPADTCGAAECAGEEGGCSCGIDSTRSRGSGAASALLLFLGAGAAARRRRRGVVVASDH